MSKFWSLIEKLVLFFLKPVYRMLHKEMTEENTRGILQFVKFGIVGVTNTLVDYLIYAGTLMALQAGNLIPSWDYIFANVVSFLLSVLWSFYWNNRFVFTKEEGEKRSVWKALLKAYLSYAFTGLVLKNALSILLIEAVHMSKLLAPILILLISVPLNFILNKFWAFRKEKNK